MKLHELAKEIKELPCGILGYAAEWRWALTSDWWQLTIIQLFWTMIFIILLWISVYRIYSNLRDGFFDYCDKKRGASTKSEAELDRKREVRQDTYASSIATFLIVIIIVLVISEISEEYIGKQC